MAKYHGSEFLLKSRVPAEILAGQKLTRSAIPPNLIKTYSVNSFIKSFCGDFWDAKISKKIEDCRVLNGILNATHFIPLDRNFPFKKLKLRSYKDNGYFSPSVISNELLKIGLLHQCAFIMPSGYESIDLIIPVCLPNNIYTFIPIQVKIPHGSGSSNIARNMNLKNHFITDNMSAAENLRIEEVFQDQLSIFISFKQEVSDGTMEVLTVENVATRSSSNIIRPKMRCIYVNGLSAFEKISFLEGCVDLIRNILLYQPGNSFAYADANEIETDRVFIRNQLINQPYRFFEAINSIRKSFKMEPVEFPEIETESFDEINATKINIQNFPALKKTKQDDKKN